jgi:hypothetical protein
MDDHLSTVYASFDLYHFLFLFSFFSSRLTFHLFSFPLSFSLFASSTSFPVFPFFLVRLLFTLVSFSTSRAPLHSRFSSAGFYCHPGAKVAREASCTAGFYCPAGSSLATGSGQCLAGFYCPIGASSATQAPCLAGYYCTAGSVVATGTGQCAIGHYCPTSSTGPTGNGTCSPGYYCPPGASSARQIPCPLGSFCVPGLATLPPPLCAAGYVCTTGMSSAQGSGPCNPGRWCPAGSTGALGSSGCPVWCCRCVATYLTFHLPPRRSSCWNDAAHASTPWQSRPDPSCSFISRRLFHLPAFATSGRILLRQRRRSAAVPRGLLLPAQCRAARAVPERALLPNQWSVDRHGHVSRRLLLLDRRGSVYVVGMVCELLHFLVLSSLFCPIFLSFFLLSLICLSLFFPFLQLARFLLSRGLVHWYGLESHPL